MAKNVEGEHWEYPEPLWGEPKRYLHGGYMYKKCPACKEDFIVSKANSKIIQCGKVKCEI